MKTGTKLTMLLKRDLTKRFHAIINIQELK